MDFTSPGVITAGTGGGDSGRKRVSVVVPAFNEAAIIEDNLKRLCEYLATIEHQYDWEIVVVDDGSSDSTGELARRLAEGEPRIRVYRHGVNYQLGQALRFAFGQCRGDYIVTFDVDLTYSPDHIGRLLDRLVNTRAKVVIASPYRAGGRVTGVPWFRRWLSRFANLYLSLATRGLNPAGTLTTITGLVRGYDARFLRSLNLKAMGAQVNSEIIHKALVLRAHIEEIPAHLDWSTLRGRGRGSSIRVISSLMNQLVFGFMFRPFAFFLVPALAMFLLGVYATFWATVHTIEAARGTLVELSEPDIITEISKAVAEAYSHYPHVFLIGAIALVLGMQLLTAGILSLQNKRYFDELFSLCTRILRGLPSDRP
jgi:glycosyltransferase involved in cell wall biosynthesis